MLWQLQRAYSNFFIVITFVWQRNSANHQLGEKELECCAYFHVHASSVYLNLILQATISVVCCLSKLIQSSPITTIEIQGMGRILSLKHVRVQTKLNLNRSQFLVYFNNQLEKTIVMAK